MAYVFPSKEWIQEYANQINSSQSYKRAAATWDKGVVALVVEAEPSVGIEEPVGIWLDLHKGNCREAKIVTKEEAEKAPFCIFGDYQRWKQVARGRLDPVVAMMQGKLKLKGDLPTIVRYVAAAKELVSCATKVDTVFKDEQ